ncbi:MAG TPA: sulfotransferase [Rhizomicrobium sp.]|jgi:tetratricopeptide (TPR) repeat protein|nr:sulfotransferase [Rhizomicrobium sp.]
MSTQIEGGAPSTAEAVSVVRQAVAMSDFGRAAAQADVFLAQGLIHPALLSARALWLERQGRDEDALTAFQQARALSPGDSTLLNAIGLCLTRLFRLDEAVGVFDEAIRINPSHAATHQRKGVALGMGGHLDAAQRAHARAVQLDPRNVEAIANLAAILAKKGDMGAARARAERVLKLDPANGTAHAALALVELSALQFSDAEQRLRKVLAGGALSDHGRAVALGLLGDALDGQDRTDDAFAAYTEANAALRSFHGSRFQYEPGTVPRLESVLSSFEAVESSKWTARDDDPNAGSGTVAHVFLLGFPRSGTTILGQALNSHPEIVTLEERDCLAEPAERYLTSASGLEYLANLGDHERAAERAAYWERVRRHGIRAEGKVFVDKHPFNTLKLPLLAKLFPRAKILFAVRDPRDVVLSCFRRHFDVDRIKYEFLTLEGAARLYDVIMRFSEACRLRLPLDFYLHRHEHLVSDFDTSTRSVCDFLGISWNAGMREFANRAAVINAQSASATQLRGGLYGEGLGQWRRYRAQMANVLPQLECWVEQFGYSPE